MSIDYRMYIKDHSGLGILAGIDNTTSNGPFQANRSAGLRRAQLAEACVMVTTTARLSNTDYEAKLPQRGIASEGD